MTNIQSSTDINLLITGIWLPQFAERTQGEYSRHLTTFFNHFQGLKITEYNTPMLQEYADLYPASINGVKSLFTFLKNTGVLRFNPAHPVKIRGLNAEVAEIRQQKHDLNFLTSTQIDSLLASVLGYKERYKGQVYRDYAMFRLMLATGLRVNEACSLKWWAVRVHQRSSKDGQHKSVGRLKTTGKGGKSREIDFSLETLNILLELRGDSAEMDYVFNSRKGGKIDTSQVRRNLKKYLKAAGFDKVSIDSISCHTLRHTFATEMLKNGADIRQVQKALGHSSTQTTDRYLHDERITDTSKFLQY